jgi:hypothetical protein
MFTDDDYRPLFNGIPQRGYQFNGYGVSVSPDVPKMQLSLDVPLTNAFREEINQWMIEFFGVKNYVPDGEVFLDDFNKRMIMNPRTFEQLKRTA